MNFITKLIFLENRDKLLFIAGVAELVYARDSKSRLARDESSSLSSGTKSKAQPCDRRLERRSGYRLSRVGRESGSGKFLSDDEKNYS